MEWGDGLNKLVFPIKMRCFALFTFFMYLCKTFDVQIKEKDGISEIVVWKFI